MTINLFDLTYRVASEIGILQEGEATGGSTTTLVDTVNLTQAEDYWNNGTVWFPYGATQATPQGEYAVVSNFVNSTSRGNRHHLGGQVRHRQRWQDWLPAGPNYQRYQQGSTEYPYSDC
jgi:hypothetical protein